MLRTPLLAALIGSALSASAPAAILTVTTTADSGLGSLRQALLDSNASVGVADTISFAIPGAGPHTVTLLSALPDVTDPVTIDATTQPGFGGTPLVELNGAGVGASNAVLTLSAGNCMVKGLAVNRGPEVGIRIRNAGLNRIYQTYVGTDPSGTIAVGNASHGIVVENVEFTYIGDPFDPTARCFVSGNGGDGIRLLGANSGNSFVSSGMIGTNVSETRLGNAGWGIYAETTVAVLNSFVAWNGSGGIALAATATESGIEHSSIRGNGGPGISVGGGTPHRYQFNTILRNAGPGVAVQSGATGVTIIDNHIFANGGLGIDLGADGRTPNDPDDSDGGANNLQNFPVVTRVEILENPPPGRLIRVHGVFQGLPSTTYRLELWSGIQGRTADDAQAAAPSGFLTGPTDAAGVWNFVIGAFLQDGHTTIAATATDPAGNTSELSVPFAIPDLKAESSACGAGGAEILLLLGILAGVRRLRRPFP